ncbi:MAG TPA: hypothetical protein PKE63_07870, partial [Lacibacter sp.]|nr:hypothetical protein [Lacibacter sp.]
MKQLLSFLFVCAALSSAGQSSEVFTKHLRATERITLRSRSVTGINWTMLDADSLNNNVFPTAKSVNDFVRNLLNGYSGGGGGGGAADSSWVSTQTGVPFSTVGFLVNTTFPGASLPAGWVDQTPDASVTISNKLIVSGGNTNVSPVNGNQGTSTVYVNRLRVAHFPYD